MRNGAWGKGGFGGDAIDMRLNVPGWDTPELSKLDSGWHDVQSYKLKPTSGGTGTRIYRIPDVNACS